jgi:hypothetical protein
MKQLLAFLAIAMGAAALGCSGATASAPVSASLPKFMIHDVKGDVLGMAYADYKKAHAQECTFPFGGKDGEHGCYTSGTTYAGIRASKDAEFYKGKLYWISYNVDPMHADELLDALKEKYGQPMTCAPDKSCTWGNEEATINYSTTEKMADVTFWLNGPLSEQVAETQKKRELAHRTDQ